MDIPLAIIFFSLLFSAFLVKVETIYFSSSQLYLELKNKQGETGAAILHRYTRYPERFFGTLVLGRLLAFALFLLFSAQELALFVSASPVQWLRDLLAVALLVIIFVTATALLCRLTAFTGSLRLLVPFHVVYWLLKPLVNIGHLLTARWLGDSLHKEQLLYLSRIPGHIHHPENASQQAESVAEVTPEMFRNALGFDQVKVWQCLIPRNEIVAVELNASISVLHQTFVESGHSKILVYRESIDNIIGYVHQVELFKRPASIRAILIPIVVATEAMPAHDLLRKFLSGRKSIAVVVDEFGGTAGIVTIEDILEEIFGEIEDEHDVEELTEQKLSETEFVFSARQEVDYLNETYGLQIPKGDYETLGGFIISQSEHIPENGQVIRAEAFEFIILDVTNGRIGNVNMKVLDKAQLL